MTFFFQFYTHDLPKTEKNIEDVLKRAWIS